MMQRDIPEVGAQVDNLPCAQADQHTHGAKGEPLDTLVCALVGISQLLLADAKVVQLANNLCDHLFNSAQFRLDGLKFLAGLDGRPVLCVGTNIDIEFNVAAGVRSSVVCFVKSLSVTASCVLRIASSKRTSSQDVLEADIKGGIGVRGESVATFASDIARSVVVIANSILDLHQQHPVSIFLYTLYFLKVGINARAGSKPGHLLCVH